MDAAEITIVCTSILTLVGVIVNYFKEGRAHRWQVEQSRFDQEQRLRVAEDLKFQQAVIAADLKAHAVVNSKAIAAKIDDNTAINVAAIEAGEKAFTEANNLSQKIHDTGLRLRGDKEVV